MSEIKLTDEQAAKIPEYTDRFYKICTSVEPADRPRGEMGIRMAYENNGFKAPSEIIWADSPKGLVREVSRREFQTETPSEQQLTEIWRAMSMGAFDGGWLCYWMFVREELGFKDETKCLLGHYEVANAAGPWAHAEEYAVVCERPLVLNLNERYQPHCKDGPFMAWPDGTRFYAVHGISVDERIVERPETITVKEILDEQNAELRRVLTELYGSVPKAERPENYLGIGAFVQDAGANCIHEIPGDSMEHPSGICGAKLLHLDFADDEPIRMLQLRNSTPEPDGTFKTVFLEVPPDQQTVPEAVAWTFNKTAKEYFPSLET